MNIKEKLYIMKQLFLKETGGSATGTSMFKRGQLLQDILDLLENNMKEVCIERRNDIIIHY